MMAPTEEMERLFGPDWPDVLDKLEEQAPVMLAYRQEATVIGFSYRHDTMCLYVGIGGERKTIPLSDIEGIDIGNFSEE